MGAGEDINRKEFARAFLLRAKADLKSAKDLLERHWIRPRYPFPEMGDIWNLMDIIE